MKAQTMTQVLFADPDKTVSIQDVALPALGDDHVRVRTAYSYLSAGTELTVLQMGTVNVSREVVREPLGYSLAGEVDGVEAVLGDDAGCHRTKSAEDCPADYRRISVRGGPGRLPEARRAEYRCIDCTAEVYLTHGPREAPANVGWGAAWKRKDTE